MTNLSIVEQSKRYFSDDEDYITLYENEDSYIYYVRNYQAQTEFLLVSVDLMMSLDEKYRTVSGVYLKPYFSVLRQFQGKVIKHVLCNALLGHFHHLFDCSVSELFHKL